ncbi:hypothetical protein BRAS3843_1830021 [Bradyrhizobium sp. STM 3843]|nr:hypothetical protein BRAS3843_1830021 [Bradyrhizobium sp. STM 3843]
MKAVVEMTSGLHLHVLIQGLISYVCQEVSIALLKNKVKM